MGPQDAERHSNKKSPGLGTIGQLAEAWAQGRRNDSDEYQLAKQIRATWPDLEARHITEPLITAMVEGWKKRYAKTTTHHRRYALKRFFIFVDQLKGTALARQVPRVSKPGARTVIATDAETQRILDAAPPWFRCMVLLCRMLGLRHSEARKLTPANYDANQDTFSFDRKWGGTSNLPVPPELSALLKVAQEIDPHAPIIETLRGKKITASVISRAWNSAKRKANANPELILHDLRRTIATALYADSKDLRAVQQLLGHRNLASTLNYIAPLDPQKLRQLLANLKPINLSQMQPVTETPQ